MSEPIIGFRCDRRIEIQHVRLMLKYREITFQEKTYTENSRVWQRRKNTLGFDFPQLPYFIDEDVKLTKRVPITRYVARKLKLMSGSGNLDVLAKMYVLEDEMEQFSSELTRIACLSNFEEELKPQYLNSLPEVLRSFSKFLGNKEFFGIMGNKETLTYLDFIMYVSLDQHLALKFSCLDEFENLKAFVERFENIPQIKRYLEEEHDLDFSFRCDIAYFGFQRQRVSTEVDALCAALHECTSLINRFTDDLQHNCLTQ